MKYLLAFIITLVILFVVPILVYGLFSKFFGVKEPEKSSKFFVSVLLQKIGNTVAFVWLFNMIPNPNWMLYAAAWFVMFSIIEVGQSMLSSYSKKEAIAGIISEAIYFPLAAYLLTLVF